MHVSILDDVTEANYMAQYHWGQQDTSMASTLMKCGPLDALKCLLEKSAFGLAPCATDAYQSRVAEVSSGLLGCLVVGVAGGPVTALLTMTMN